MKLVVITGCLGLIGTSVTRKCLSKGWKVYGIDKLTYAANIESLHEFQDDDNFTFVKEDIVTLSFLPNCDYIINIAAETHVGNSIINSDDFLRSNVLGIKNLLDLIRQKPGNVDDSPIFFQFSTDEVYGDIVDGEHFESDHLNPSNPYSASKAAADMLILAWARTYAMSYVILRPTNNYGPAQYPEKLIPICVKQLLRGKKIRLHNEGKPIRNWLHTEDTAEAVIKIIESKQKNKIFNVSGGFEQKNIETVKKIIQCVFGEAANLEDYVDLNYSRLGQDVRYAVNDGKLRDLGWRPMKIFDDEIAQVVNYYIENFKW